MSSETEVASFIQSTFHSVWALELMLFLKRGTERAWPVADVVAGMRASELVVARSLDALLAAGLVGIEADGASRFGPASPDLARLADAAEALYASSPAAVRRLIVTTAGNVMTPGNATTATGGLGAFADSFRLRRD